MNRSHLFLTILSLFIFFTSGLFIFSFASDYEIQSDNYINEDSEEDKIKQKAKEHGKGI